MKTVKVRNTVIGEGIPKICVPVFEKTKEEILSEAGQIAGLKPDIVEFRADRFERCHDFDSLEDVLTELRTVLGEIPLLFTLRTLAEGGDADIGDDDYTDINIKACKSGTIDMVDAEALRGADIAPIIEAAHSLGVKIVASHHDFEKTPEKDVIIEQFRKMQETGADILKIAVMPQSNKDVSSLLAAAEEMVTEYAECPVVAISMGELGTVSRLAGEAVGSAITFGAASNKSAPGQIGIEELREGLKDFHEELVAETSGSRKEQ